MLILEIYVILFLLRVFYQLFCKFSNSCVCIYIYIKSEKIRNYQLHDGGEIVKRDVS